MMLQQIHRHILMLAAMAMAAVTAGASTPILGDHEVDIERMYWFVAERNPDFDIEVAEAFYEVGRIYGVRGDIALCQAIIETGWFRFDNGTAVTADAHNYCGLGVHSTGEKGCSFPGIREGVTAMIQHLYAYACRNPLPEGEELLDPRFTYVSRGSAKAWESLSGRWAMNPRYGRDILDMYKRLNKYELKDLPE